MGPAPKLRWSAATSDQTGRPRLRLAWPEEQQRIALDSGISCNSRHYVDHLVVGPTGLFVIDSKRYRGHLHYSAGRLWHGRRPLDRTLETLWWEATQVAETLGFGPDLHVYPVLCVHVARLPWLRELLVDGIPVLAAGTLRPALRVIRQALSPEQVELVAAQVRAGFQPAA
jgi:hypothetical protein